MTFSLNLWRVSAAFFEKLGPPRFRRWLADMAILLVPDPNLPRLRYIINIMDETSQAIFNGKKASLTKGDENIAQIGEAQDVMSTLRTRTR